MSGQQENTNQQFMYDYLKASILWYKLFARTPQKHGFIANPYDPFIANNMMDNQQPMIM